MPLRLGTVVPLLQIFDMQRSVRFYRDVLGFEVIATSSNSGMSDYWWAMLQFADAKLMLNTAYEEGASPPIPDANRVAAHSDTELFFTCPDLDEAYLHFRSKAIPVEGPVLQPYGMKELRVVDPDGFSLCFQCPTEMPP